MGECGVNEEICFGRFHPTQGRFKLIFRNVNVFATCLNPTSASLPIVRFALISCPKRHWPRTDTDDATRRRMTLTSRHWHVPTDIRARGRAENVEGKNWLVPPSSANDTLDPNAMAVPLYVPPFLPLVLLEGLRKNNSLLYCSILYTSREYQEM